MTADHVGYVEFEGKVRRFTEAAARLNGHELDVEAAGPKWNLLLYGICFPGDTSAADLEGKQFGPASDSMYDDPFAEGGIDTPTMRLSWTSLLVRCGRYDPASRRMTATFEAEVIDHESGLRGSATGSARCEVSDRA